MANPIERIKSYTNKITTTHFPFNTNGEYDIDSSPKVKSILECLYELGLDYIQDKRYGIIVANSFNKEHENNNKAIKEKLEEVDLIVVSHIDMISKFNKKEVLDKFKDDFSKLDKLEDEISGPLDNTITNATLLALLALRVKNLSDDCKDIMVIFSIGEEDKAERGFKEKNGTEKFMDKFVNHLKDDVKFINLDVTASEYHDYKNDEKIVAFIEYDDTFVKNKLENHKYSKLDIFENLDIDENIMFCEYEDGTSDDLEEIAAYEEMFGFTLGLNTYGTIHSLKNRTTVRNIDSYFNQLNKFFDSEFFRPSFR
ncbi:hypothetical protein NG749_04215 [Aliarcobacter cryaerophilus]|uniref:hypothetical protein n=1 Tax=Aliarcobacter cryaerophilus TaxID=28198 RepID=UPI003DA33CE6